jgi:hypothetical protein
MRRDWFDRGRERSGSGGGTKKSKQVSRRS